MKYIKLFEKMEPRYYILKGNNKTMVKLIDYDKWDDNLPYFVRFIDGELQWFPAGKFARDMTEKEIDFFEKELEIIDTANKYNL